MIKVLLVDDHDLVRAGIKLMLQNIPNLRVIGEASSGEEATKAARQLKPDIILMDVNMPGIGGLEATRKIVKMAPEIKVLVVSVYNDELFPMRLLQAGAVGYLTKDASMEEMVRAIQYISSGQRYISPSVAHQLALTRFNKGQETPFAILSERELQISYMIIRGIPPKKIAEQLNLSLKTVNSYRYRIFDKVSVNSDVELTLLAIKCGLIEASKIDAGSLH